MKAAIFISGIGGTLLIVLRIIGIMADFQFNDHFLYSGAILLLAIFLPLTIIEKYLHNKKIDRIIHENKGGKHNKEEIHTDNPKTKGWGMNNSPFRDRKSGLSWGGGNVKAANATRGKRKSFLK
ncbi:MAG: hypothetical protein C0599_05565 [Salinivirgaceae bacterium]|nr:MAG: hypothetical protein C0599_05565 [Salinivirgaceae bacterium]